MGGINHVWNLGAWHPFIGPHGGYVGGKGVQDGALIGPEVGVNYDVADKWFLYGRAGYDNNFRNDLGQGIVNGGIGVGLAGNPESARIAARTWGCAGRFLIITLPGACRP